MSEIAEDGERMEKKYSPDAVSCNSIDEKEAQALVGEEIGRKEG